MQTWGLLQVLLNLEDLNLQEAQRLLFFLVKSDARYTSQRIADMILISKASALCFRRNILKRKLLKRFPRYDQKIFMNVVVGDKPWIHYTKPHRKISNRVWLTKNARRPCIATRITSAKHVVYTILFTTKGLAIQVLIPKGKSMNHQGFTKKCS